MITKIDIDNVAVFKQFKWDESVKKNTEAVPLKKINVIYGPNYSGKTTLSRIIRSFEKKELPPYEETKFKIYFDSDHYTESDVNSCKSEIRVFNEDFIKENLAFISNPEEGIKPFAILGQNIQIEQNIQRLKTELGENGPEKFTGLYKKSNDLSDSFKQSSKKHEGLCNFLEKQLNNKATAEKRIAIKYNTLYNIPNYNINYLKEDIKKAQSISFLEENEKSRKLELLKEIEKIPISHFSYPEFSINTIDIKLLVEQEITATKKIKELIENTLLHNWVKDGIELNKHRETCAFCGSFISSQRWQELQNHFDKSLEELENKLDQQIEIIEEHRKKIEKMSFINKEQVYSQFSKDHSDLQAEFNQIKKEHLEFLDFLASQLKKRKTDILHKIELVNVNFDETKILTFNKKVSEFIEKNNSFRINLKNEQEKARECLRLQDINEYLTSINYKEQLSKINKAEKEKKEKEQECSALNNEIQQKESEVQNLHSQLYDETEGAKLINSYLEKAFGLQSLQLELLNEKDQIKSSRFVVKRGTEIAKNMSEGECRLIAFCYFVAKLEDSRTKGKKPIIWIDDPICSLDSNHIFYIFSLIKSKIIGNNCFEQLTISTHNLNFLKYLLQLKPENSEINEKKRTSRFLILEKNGSTASIKILPLYMYKYVSEFNFLFEQIFRCATEQQQDNNYMMYYSFGNNARKFLELYLYYKYPDSNMKDSERYYSFFESEQSVSFVNRLINEYSHIGVFERAEEPVNITEISKCAKLICNTIKKNDEKQYNALVNSISKT